MKILTSILLLFSSISLFGQVECFNCPTDTIYVDNPLSSQVYGEGVYLPRITTIYASDYGFSPDSSATANVLAWNSMPSGRSIIVDDTGTYNIDSLLVLKSNTTYRISKGIKLRKYIAVDDFCHAIINEHAYSGQPDSNIYFYADSLVLDLNSSNRDVGGVLGMKANIMFYKLKNFVFSGIYSNNPNNTTQFFLSLADCQNGTIRDINTKQPKDGFDLLGKNSNINIKNCTLATSDDAIFIGAGYGANTPVLGDNTNILIDSCTFATHDVIAGYCIRLYCASWETWTSGHSYSTNESVLYNGRIYTKLDTGTDAASNAPTHASGQQQYADGITWRFVQNGTITGANVKNVTVRNSTVGYNRLFCDLSNMVVTDGTEGQGIIDSITFDNIVFPATYNNWAFTHEGQVGLVDIKNINFTHISAAYAGGFIHGNVTGGKASFDSLSIYKVHFTPTQTNGTFIQFSSNAAYSFSNLYCDSVKIIGSGLYVVIPIGTQKLNFNKCEFGGLNRLASSASGVTYNAQVLLDSCKFITPINYVVANTHTNNVMNYTSTRTHYVDPTSNLFFNNQATTTMNINVSTSTGTITQAKVRNGVLVNVVACDIPYL